MMIRNVGFGLLGAIIGATIIGSIWFFQDEEQVVATVGTKVITQKDLIDELETVGGSQILMNMIDVQVIGDVASKYKLSVTDEEANQELSDYKLQFQTDEEYEVALTQSGITEQELIEQLETNILFRKLAVKDVKITDEEIKAYYDEHKTELSEEEQVKARHILVSSEEEAKKIREQLEQGEDFATLAKEKSEDEMSAVSGGDLGFFGRGLMDPSFEEIAFSLKPGEISQPVKTEFGFHIIEVQERKEAKEPTLEEAQSQVKERLMEEKAKTADVLLPELRKEVGVDIKDKRYKDIFS